MTFRSIFDIIDKTKRGVLIRMSSLLILLLIGVFLALEAWFVVSLILFIVSMVKKKPERKGMMVMFIISAVLKTIVPFLGAFLVIITKFAIA